MEDNSHLINQLYREISELSNAMSKNNEILARLRKSYQDISSSQDEFMQNKRYIDQPELTASTWAGKHANEFNEIRKEIESSYMGIGNNDIEGMLNNIEDKISYYEGLNKSLSNAISSKRNRISQLRD